MSISDSRPEKALAIAVVQHALFQAKRKKPSALAWFSRRDSYFAFWCEALDLDPDALSERVMGLLNEGERNRPPS